MCTCFQHTWLPHWPAWIITISRILAVCRQICQIIQQVLVLVFFSPTFLPTTEHETLLLLLLKTALRLGPLLPSCVCVCQKEWANGTRVCDPCTSTSEGRTMHIFFPCPFRTFM